MRDILTGVLLASLVLHLALIAVCVWRVWHGENVMDRLVAADLIGTLVLAVFVLIAMIRRDNLFIDVALGLAALSAIGTIALARYTANRQMF